jgi:hypothetical protein
MPFSPLHLAAEIHFRELLAAGGIADPDHVEYWDVSVAFFWHEQRLVVVVELAEDELQLDDLLALGLVEQAGQRLH